MGSHCLGCQVDAEVARLKKELNLLSSKKYKEEERILFEYDALGLGFDVTRYSCAATEPWSEYLDRDTGHRWAGWLAAKGIGE